MAESKVIDQMILNTLLESVGGDETFLAELMETYLQDAPAQLASMEQALSSGNAEEFRRAAHSLKANSASFGAVELSQVCRQLEELGKSGRLESAAEQVARAEIEFEKVKQALLETRNLGD
jgi:HPt (histidine-containing phosphotransfer) domain-containing protein